MKKLIALLIASIMVLSLVSLVGCQTTPATLKLGLGVSISASGSDATAEENGEDKLTVTAAAVLVDNNGKIAACALDTASNTVNFTADGKAVASTGFKTKYEAGKNYNMVAYGGAAKEWFEQAAAFDAACVGKTASEIAGFVGEDGKGTADIQSAGCTIYVTGFGKAASKI